MKLSERLLNAIDGDGVISNKNAHAMANSFGKTVFLTREEAEAALKGEMEDARGSGKKPKGLR